MALFTDTFNRANGALGNGWTRAAARWQVSGNQAYLPTGPDMAARLGELPYTMQRIQVTLSTVPVGGDAYLTLRGQAANSANVYYVLAWRNGAALHLDLRKNVSSVATVLAQTDVGSTDPNGRILAFEAVGNNLRVYVDGTLQVSATDSTFASGPYYGFGSNYLGLTVDDFVADVPTTPAFVATGEAPALVGQPWTISLINNYGTWTPGAPGSPTFTVDSGTILSQVVASSTQATLVWQPDADVTILTITDPDASLTAFCYLSGGLGGQLAASTTEAYYTYLSNHALSPQLLWEILQFIVSLQPFFPEGGSSNNDVFFGNGDYPGTGPTLLDLITTMGDVTPWRHEGPAPLYTLRQLAEMDHSTTDHLDDEMYELRTEDDLTLASVKGWLDALETGYLDPTLDHLDALRTPAEWTLDSVLTWVNAVRGSGSPTIRDVLDNLGALRTGDALDLGDIVTEIRAVRGAGLPTVRQVYDYVASLHDVDLPDLHDDLAAHVTQLANARADLLVAIAEVAGTPAASVRQVLDTLVLHDGTLRAFYADLCVRSDHLHNDLAAIVPAVQSAINTHETHILNELNYLNSRITDVLSAVGDVHTDLISLSASENAHYLDIVSRLSHLNETQLPLWPGVANVTLGVGQALTGDQKVDVACDGVLIELSNQPSNTSIMHVDGYRAHGHIGFIAFLTDRGETEEAQWLGINKRVFLPKSCLTASGFVLHCRPGVQALVTPWQRNV